MRKILVGMSALLALTLTPALAKDKNKLISIDDVRDAERAGKKFLNEERALELYEEKVDRLQGRLYDAGDDERQRIENIIESVTEKYEAKWGELPEEPPPPPEEPTVLFKDDFNRENGSGLGNGWTEKPTDTPAGDNAIRIQDNAAVFETDVQSSEDGSMTSGYAQSPTFHADYKTTTITYSVTGLQGTGTLESEWTVNGNTWIPIESQTVTAGATYTYSGKLEDTLTMENPEAYLGSVEDGNFATRFSYVSTSGDNAVAIDDFSLTQEPASVEPFVGY
jgi:hypothetical protein